MSQLPVPGTYYRSLHKSLPMNLDGPRYFYTFIAGVWGYDSPYPDPMIIHEMCPLGVTPPMMSSRAPLTKEEMAVLIMDRKVVSHYAGTPFFKGYNSDHLKEFSKLWVPDVRVRKKDYMYGDVLQHDLTGWTWMYRGPRDYGREGCLLGMGPENMFQEVTVSWSDLKENYSLIEDSSIEDSSIEEREDIDGEEVPGDV